MRVERDVRKSWNLAFVVAAVLVQSGCQSWRPLRVPRQPPVPHSPGEAAGSFGFSSTPHDNGLNPYSNGSTLSGQEQAQGQTAPSLPAYPSAQPLAPPAETTTDQGRYQTPPSAGFQDTRDPRDIGMPTQGPSPR